MFNDACQNIQLPYFKYVDDLTLLENRVSQDPVSMQNILTQLTEWSHNNHMKLNPLKCITMTVTFMKNPAPFDTLYIGESPLPNVQTVKILGVHIQSNLKWDDHVNEILKKCNKKLYMFRMVKKYKLPIADLVTIYTGYIRPVLEYCVPVFNGGLTLKQVQSLERVQKRVCRIILGKDYISYENAIVECKLERLETRREKLCIDFAKSLSNNPHCKDWLPKQKNVGISLRSIPKFNQYKCKTNRFRNSAIPYFIDLLNCQ